MSARITIEVEVDTFDRASDVLAVALEFLNGQVDRPKVRSVNITNDSVLTPPF